jgi:FxsC-like protein
MQHNQIVVLLADVWASRLDDELGRLQNFDEAREAWGRVPCAVLLPGNHADGETHHNWRQLKSELVTILPRRLVDGDARLVNLGPIRTHGAFEYDLRVALQTAQQEVFRRGTVHGRVDDTDLSPRPILTLPDQPPEPRDEA